MKLSDTIKTNIINEYNSFKKSLYAGKSREERKELDQFFTPPELTIQMIEKMDCEDIDNESVLDPCCGSGNLLVACLLAGFKGKNIYGNEYDERMVKICRQRLNNVCDKYGLEKGNWNTNIHQGNALQSLCLIDFSNDYEKNYKTKYIDDLKYAQDKSYANWQYENEKANKRNNRGKEISLWHF